MALPPAAPILAVEPIFDDFTHAPVNAGLLQALAATGAARVVFAAHPAHHAAVCQAAPALRDAVGHCAIAVEPRGGISFGRLRRHLALLSGLTAGLAPRHVICLAVTPETLFACALLRLRRPRLPVTAILHGNLAEMIGWRSRDPRRRLLDATSALRAARRAGVRFVVLEDYVRAEARRRGLLGATEGEVWPHPILDAELAEPSPAPPGLPVRLGWIGFGRASKGFADFIALADRLAGRSDALCRLVLVGRAEAGFESRLGRIETLPDLSDRRRFVEAVRGIDYSFLSLPGATYRLISSGSVLDSLAAAKPFIGLDAGLARAVFGTTEVGHFADGPEALTELLADRERLLDMATYRRFQQNLVRLRAERSPAGLARVIAASLGAA